MISSSILRWVCHNTNVKKLYFSYNQDVLIKPKRSTIRSRADADLTREFVFRNSRANYNGIPIMASNMDTVASFEMAVALNKFNVFTCVHKHYQVDDWKDFAAKNPDVFEVLSFSTICLCPKYFEFRMLRLVEECRITI